MSNIHIGVVHNYNHREMTINTPSATNVAEVVRAFMNDTAEDIQAEDIKAEEAHQQKENKPEYFPLLTEQCRKEGKMQIVENELRDACRGTATALWRTIRTNEALGYVSSNHLDAREVYHTFVNYFGQLPYNERNFRDARTKR